MEVSPNFYDVFKEVYAVLSLTENEFVEKIPDSIFQSIISYASKSDIEPHLDVNKELAEQDISDESKSILSILWYEYVCKGEEKTNIAKKWLKND
jgi:hypothetical protein